MKVIKHLFFAFIALIPLIYLAVIWKKIPGVIPTHFNAAMEPNAYGHKSFLIFVSCILSGVSLFVYFLVQNIDKIDPKRAGLSIPQSYNIISVIVPVFVLLLNMLIISFSINNDPSLFKRKLLIPLVSLFIAIMGLVMRHIKPNYFIGVRLPWTLHSDYNWKKTHLLAGNLWFVCGLLAAILSLCFPVSYSAVILRVFAGIIVVIPIAYSFILFKREQTHPEIAKQDNDN